MDKVSELAQLKKEIQRHLETEPDRADAVTAAELRGLLHLDSQTFYRWQRLGKFDLLEIPLGPGVRKRYARKLVMALLEGERPVQRKRSA